ncbi:MAG: hypothetical protein FWE06_03740 [Oscillospiraceae bacterium]|nr:hypothetical protein [Oscillospiraceae bacterium]
MSNNNFPNDCMNEMQNERVRRFFITINHSDVREWTHDKIRDVCEKFPTIRYFCFADEIGNESKRLHSHIYIELDNAMRFSTMINNFNGGHVQKIHEFGTGFDCRNYIRKDGRHFDKHDTVVENTFYEWGQVPQDKSQGKRNDWSDARTMLNDGFDVDSIIDTFPHLMRYRNILENEMLHMKSRGRQMKGRAYVTYIQGRTNLGKTTWVFDEYGDDEVCNIIDYENKNQIFDSYMGERVLLLDEFDSSITYSILNGYIDRRKVKLSARYHKRTVCYEKIYIVSNLPLEKQYEKLKKDNRAFYDTFIRRIDKVMVYTDFCKFNEYTTSEYFELLEHDKSINGFATSESKKQTGFCSICGEFDCMGDNCDDLWGEDLAS